MSKLGEYKVGDQFVDYLMVYDKRVLKTKTNKDFLVVDIGDASYKYPSKIWDSIQEFSFVPGDIVKIGAEVIEYNNVKELKILKYKKPTDEELTQLPANKFIQIANEHKIEEAWKNIQKWIGEVKNPTYKNILKIVFDDEEIVTKFKQAPAAKRHHEAYIGGLVIHTNNVLKNSLVIQNNYVDLDSDLLITATILHDIGKINTYTWTSKIDFSEPGTFLEHITLGIMLLQQKIANAVYDQTDMNKLFSAIASSHGQHDWGSPVLPKTPEAMVLHLSDLLDTKLANFAEEKENNKSGKNFVWSSSFNGFIWAK